MDYVIVNQNLFVIDYLRNKEFIISKNKALFLDSLHDQAINYRLGMYCLLADFVIGHPYAIVYSSVHFVDYRDTQTVNRLEAKVVNHDVYEEYQTKDNIDYYFLNPVLYKKQLSWLDKIGAVLYFTCGVKCQAQWFDAKHIKKFVPSNGARYPFKAKISIPDKLCLKPGLYDYEMRGHGLHLVNNQADSPAGCVELRFVADVSRVMSRYPNGVAYRDSLFDFGHLLATLRQSLAFYQLQVVSFSEIFENKFDLINLPFLRIAVKYADTLHS